jgi:uncharacterized protein DUF6188
MYGVPTDLDLERFVGSTLIQVALGEFEIQFRFHPEGEIAVGGRWELRGQSGHLVDQAQPTRDRDAYRVHQLLGRVVVGSQVDAPRSITLEFDNGHRLQVFDSSREYESFTIQPGDIIV